MARRKPNRERKAKRQKLQRAKVALQDGLAEIQINGGVEQITDLLNFDFNSKTSDKTYTSIEEIIKDIKNRMHYGVYWATQLVFTVAETATENWYLDFTPKEYYRQDYMYDTLFVWSNSSHSPTQSYVSGYSGHVAPNPNYLRFIYPVNPKEPEIFPPSGQQVFANAEVGLHGVEHPRDKEHGVEKGIGIWHELIGFLFNESWGMGESFWGSSGLQAEYGSSNIIDTAFDVGFYKGTKPNKNWNDK